MQAAISTSTLDQNLFRDLVNEAVNLVAATTSAKQSGWPIAILDGQGGMSNLHMAGDVEWLDWIIIGGK